MKIQRYNTKAKKLARTLRQNSTKSEVLLWLCLKGKQIGYRFIRQKPIGPYIVDFYCKELKIAIEVDGEYHSYIEGRDKNRENYLKDRGIKVLRYSADDVEKSPDGVAQLIKEDIEKQHTYK